MRSPEGRFREELGLSGASPLPGTVVALARQLGFDRAAFVDPSRLARWAGLWPLSGAEDIEAGWVLSPGEGSRSSSILVCCLSCRRVEPHDLSTPGEPHGLIAPFARAHYYRRAPDLPRAL